MTTRQRQPLDPRLIYRLDQLIHRIVGKRAPRIKVPRVVVVTSTTVNITTRNPYVQSWIQAIRDKPETLIRAIKDAQSAALFMDWKAGLITDMEYSKGVGSAMEITTRSRDRDAR